MTNKPKRDHFDGAVPAEQYFTANLKSNSNVKEHLKSKSSARINISKADTRKVRESHIQTEITRYLRSCGAWVHKAKALNVVGDGIAVPTQQGVPDLLVCYDGVFLGLEIKAATNKAKVSGEQLAQMSNIISSGGIAAVVWSVEQVEAIIDAIDSEMSADEICYMTASYLKHCS